MSLSYLKALITRDVTDGSAATVSAANSSVWPTAADVADYAFTSLGTLLVGSATTSGEMENRVFYKQQQSGVGNSKGSISLIGIPAESVLVKTGQQSNSYGATTMMVQIQYTLPQNNTDWNKLNNLSLRMRYLLDHTWRRRRSLGPVLTISPSPDKGVASGIRCTWFGWETPPSATQCVELWQIEYDNIVPRA